MKNRLEGEHMPSSIVLDRTQLPGAQAQPWRHYGLKQRATSWVSRHVFDRIVYTNRHGLLKGMKRKGGLGWLPERLCGSLLTPEIRFWQEAHLEERVIYDVGAFQGMLTLFFARQGSRVVAYEPVQRNRQRLLENVALNHLSNVSVRPVALGASAGTGVMAVDPLMSGGSKLGAEPSPTASIVSERVEINTLDRDIQEHGLPEPGFVKIDVEGFELSVLQGAARTLQRSKPDLFLEMHGETMEAKIRKTGEIVTCLFDLGYRNITHIESGSAITPENSPTAARGHLYCHVPERTPVFRLAS